MREPVDNFNRGVELAYLLNEAIDIGADLDNGAIEISQMRALDYFAERTENIASDYSSRGFIKSARPYWHMHYVEPYSSLLETVENLYFSARYPEEWESNPKEYSYELVEKLTVAVGGLIGRDVYIAGMNPCEFKNA